MSEISIRQLLYLFPMCKYCILFVYVNTTGFQILF